MVATAAAPFGHGADGRYLVPSGRRRLERKDDRTCRGRRSGRVWRVDRGPPAARRTPRDTDRRLGPRAFAGVIRRRIPADARSLRQRLGLHTDGDEFATRMAGPERA